MKPSLCITRLPAFILVPLVATAAGLLAQPALAQSQSPRRYCARVVNDDTLRPPPASLEGALKHLFNISGQYALKTSFYRCAGGKVMLCTIGANLPCGKADMSTHMPQADAWCRKNPNSRFIPLAVTGHDTPYDWHCVGRKAKAGRMIAKVDKRGFFVEYWKELR